MIALYDGDIIKRQHFLSERSFIYAAIFVNMTSYSILKVFYILETQTSSFFRAKKSTVKNKKKGGHPYLIQYKLSHRNETGIGHHGLLST